MNETYLEAVAIHRIQRDLVNRFPINVTSSAYTQNENWNRTRNVRKNYEIPGWIFCVGALVRQKGFPAVRVGLGRVFLSVRLDLESLVFVVCFRRPGKWRKRIDVDI